MSRYFEAFTLKKTLASTAQAYAAGAQIGGVVQLGTVGDFLVEDDGGACLLQSVTLVDLSKTTAGKVTLLFFDQAPILTSLDNQAFALADAEALKCIGVMDMSVTGEMEKIDSAAQTFFTRHHLDLLLKARVKGRSFWMVAVATGVCTLKANGIQVALNVSKQ